MPQPLSVETLQGRINTLERSIAAINERLALVNPESGDISGARRKILELDQRLVAIETGQALAAGLATRTPGRPYSE